MYIYPYVIFIHISSKNIRITTKIETQTRDLWHRSNLTSPLSTSLFNPLEPSAHKIIQIGQISIQKLEGI